MTPFTLRRRRSGDAPPRRPTPLAYARSAPRGRTGPTAARALRPLAAAALALTVAACGGGARPDAPPVAFDTARARVIAGADTIPLLVEVARTEAQRARGLQQRETLDPGSGMVFLFDSLQAPDQGFWMWRTLIPLDLAYVGPGGEILAVRSMEPCDSPVPEWCEEASIPYRPGVPYAAALEVGRGWLERHGVGPGARLEVEGEELLGGPP